MKQWQRYLAEMFGTFILVFVGCVSLVAVTELSTRSGTVFSPHFTAPFAFGLALMAGLYTFAEVSGGHFNPAVSLGLFLDRRLTFEDLLGYWIFQFAGAILASLLMLIPFNHDLVKGTANVPHGNGASLFVEIATTAVFVLVILQSTKSERFGGSALVAIPLTLVAIHFATIPIDGTSVNPARSLGPALVGAQWTGFWIFVIGPAVGAIIAWIIYTVVIKGDTNLTDDMQRIRDEVRPPAAGTPPAAS
ncbi:MAG TPA: aquaporin [Gaiellaceae bacterium]|nr:aquaporin [Gaiellaceae bacterium]